MLNRRAFCKTLTTLGMGMLLPTLRPTDSSIVPATHTSTGAVGSATYRISGPPGSATATAQDVAHQNSVLNSLLELERCADLLDDLDCIEVVKRFGPALEPPCWIDAEPMRGTSHCPFCGEVSFHVGPESFTCKWCEAEGSAIEFYARAEGVPQVEATLRLEALLKDGSLKGRRRENEHACMMLEEAQRFYHELLCERPEGAMARQCLAGQGITLPRSSGFGLAIRRLSRMIS